MLQNPLGRLQIGLFLVRSSEPAWYRCAQLYRASLLRKTRIAVIVGSFGKTTSTRAVTAALGGDVRSLSERNSGFSLTRAVLRIPPWTRHAAIEVGISRMGQMARSVAMIQPDIAVVTCIGSEHHRTFRTLEVTRDQKAVAVRCLPANGLAVLNGDDPHVRWMRDQTSARVITFGFESSNDVQLKELSPAGLSGARLVIGYGARRIVVHSRLIGRHMVYPMLAAVALTLGEGLVVERAVEALQALEPTPGRMQPVFLPQGGTLLRDDYKSTLETIDAALDAFAAIAARRRILVIGAVSEPPGSQGPIYRRLGKRIAEIGIARVVLLADQKACQRYRAGMSRAGFNMDRILYQGYSVTAAIELLRRTVGEGDVVLIKGRNTQRLERIAFGLEGKNVRCDLSSCSLTATRCAHCVLLEQPPGLAGIGAGILGRHRRSTRS